MKKENKIFIVAVAIFLIIPLVFALQTGFLEAKTFCLNGDCRTVWPDGGPLLRTYSGLAPITVDNDSNEVGLNVAATDDWNGTFDGLDANEFTLDRAYDQETGERTIFVDDGNVVWDLGNNDSFRIFQSNRNVNTGFIVDARRIEFIVDSIFGSRFDVFLQGTGDFPGGAAFFDNDSNNPILVMNRAGVFNVGPTVQAVTWFPLSDNLYDLGGVNEVGGDFRWRDLYLAGTIKGQGEVAGGAFSFDLNGESGNFDTIGDVNSFDLLARGDLNNNASGSDANFNRLEADFFFGDGSGLTGISAGGTDTNIFAGGNIDVNQNTAGHVLVSFNDTNYQSVNDKVFTVDLNVGVDGTGQGFALHGNVISDRLIWDPTVSDAYLTLTSLNQTAYKAVVTATGSGAAVFGFSLIGSSQDSRIVLPLSATIDANSTQDTPAASFSSTVGSDASGDKGVIRTSITNANTNGTVRGEFFNIYSSTADGNIIKDAVDGIVSMSGSPAGEFFSYYINPTLIGMNKAWGLYEVSDVNHFFKSPIFLGQNDGDEQISSSGDGTVDVNAGTQINLTAIDVNISNNLGVAGELNVLGESFQEGNVMVGNNVIFPTNNGICGDSDATRGNGNDCNHSITFNGNAWVIQ